jgi:hypothetical protein
LRYVQPYDQPSNPTAPYVDLNESMGVDGSVFPAKFFNNIQAELLNVIVAGGLTPDDAVLDQLLQAIQNLIPPPSGGPSDASLVHFGSDTGTANSLIVTPSPVTSSVGVGWTLFFIPAVTNTGATNITINLSPSGNTMRSLRRANGTALQAGDLVAGQLACAVCTDGVNFRMAWLHNRDVVSDGTTVFGNGTASNPLSARTGGPGVAIGESVTITIALAGSYANPLGAGFNIGSIHAGSELTSGFFVGTNANLIGVTPLDAGTNLGFFSLWPGATSAVYGTVPPTSSWRLVHWYVTSGLTGVTAFQMVFKRES